MTRVGHHVAQEELIQQKSQKKVGKADEGKYLRFDILAKEWRPGGLAFPSATVLLLCVVLSGRVAALY